MGNIEQDLITNKFEDPKTLYKPSTIYDFNAMNSNDINISLKHFKNKVILIINMGPEEDFAKQCRGFHEMYLRYKEEGFIILGFVCD